MTFRLAFLASAAAVLVSAANAQTLIYAWPALGMDPCAEWLNCASGCSACNSPASSSAALIGTAAAFIGLDACAHPVVPGDNAVHTSGWGPVPAEQRIIISLIGLVPLRIDSIIVRHGSAPGGPDRLLIEYVRLGPEQESTLLDVPVQLTFEQTVFTDAGLLKAEGDQPFGSGQLILKAYGGDARPWLLDEVRIVTSPEISTGIGVPDGVLAPARGFDAFDALGRQLNPSSQASGLIISPGAGASVAGRKH